MKLFGAKIVIRDGEAEYSSDTFIEASSEPEAAKRLDKYIETYASKGLYPGSEDIEPWHEMRGDYRFIKWERLSTIINLTEAVRFVGKI